MKRLSLLWVVGAVLSCGGCAREEGYEVLLEIVGPPEAFSGRTLEVQGVKAPPAQAKTGQPQLWTTQVAVCTRDRDAFLKTPLRVRVLQGEQVLVDRQVERVACRLSPRPAGEREHDLVYLEQDGKLVTDFGADPRTEAVCFPPDAPIPCPQPHF